MRSIFIIIFFGTIYSQCSNYTSMECNNSSNCEWIEDISYASCSSLGTSNSSFCDAQPNCSYSWLTYSCGGGTYAVDNSYCQEVEILECSALTHGPCLNDEECEWIGSEDGYCQDYIISVCDDINEVNCNNNDSCDWIENIQFGNCNGNSSLQCDNDDNCEWVNNIVYGNCSGMGGMGECNATPGCNYSTLTYTCNGSYIISDNSYCGGGNYEIDNSYCEEIEILECSQYNELQCNADSSCNWIDDYYWDNCSNYNSSTSCSTANSNGGNCNWSWNSTLWQDTCSGGSFQADASYCDESPYLLGDATGDFSINILDVIQIVNLILNNQYNMTVDMNNDNQLNVLDVILVVDIILGN